MTRENKLVMVVGFGFLLFLGILVSDHLAANTTPLKQELVSYRPDPKALPGETERFGARALPETEPLPPVDSSDIGIAIGGAPNGMQGLGAPGTIDVVGQGASSRPAGERVHKIAKGENPETIAKKYYGKRALGAKLAEFNGIKPTDLKIGRELRIPDIAVLDPKSAPQEQPAFPAGTIAIAPEGAAAGVQQTPAPQPESAPRIATRRLRDGDTLYGIAREVYGDGTRWPEIASLNGLGKNPKLRPGMEIKYALAD